MNDGITIEGVLVPIDWEDNGRVRSVGLNTYDDRELRLEVPLGVDSSLWSLVGRRVRVTGRVQTTEIIVIESFRVIE